MSRHAIVVGGGLAGVGCAQALGRTGLQTTLVDRHDYHQFQPLLYQIATSQLPARDVARPLETIFHDLPSVQVVNAEVSTADLDERSVTLADGRTLAADFLVLAAGARPNFFGIPGADEHAMPLYSVADAERLRLRLQALLRAEQDHGSGAAGSTSPRAVNIVVVGAGPTGVETAGAIAELLSAMHSEGADSPHTVCLVDRGDLLLPQFSDKAHAYAHRQLTERDVEIRLGVGVTAVHEDRVTVADETSIPADVVVWAGGESAASLAQCAGPRAGRGGRIDVQADLTVAGHRGVYAVGDVANVATSKDGPLPQLGSVAQQSGRWAADNIERELRGEPTVPFRYKDKGIMAMIGRNAAVAQVGKRHHTVDGPIAFAAWLGVHAMLLSGVHSKTDAFLTWAWDYFDRDHAGTVASQSAPSRIAWADEGEHEPHILLDSA